MLKVTNDEKLLLWATLSNNHDEQYKLAFNVYRNLFAVVPQAENMFPRSMHPTSPDVKSHASFQRMALQLVRLLWLTATHVETLEKQSMMLQDIGKMHSKYVDRGLKSIHWTAMESAMILALKQYSYESSALATEQQKKTVAKIWKNLTHYVIQQCREGFDEAIRNKHDSSDVEENANSSGKPWWSKCIS